jgi:crossover junction endodeoxyribonuclease RuvC
MTQSKAHNPSIIALDPGMNGAIAIAPFPVRGEPFPTNGKIIPSVQPFPISGKTLDLVALAQTIRGANPVLAVIEKVGAMPKQGVASTFKFGQGYGSLLGICAALAIPVELVTPQRWKGSILAGTAKDKDAAIAYCRRAFPEVPLVMPGYRKPHDGVADALCLLQFGMREFVRESA